MPDLRLGRKVPREREASVVARDLRGVVSLFEARSILLLPKPSGFSALAVAVLNLACSRRVPSGRSDPGARTAASEPEPILTFSGALALHEGPLPGEGLQLFMGGPPWRRCERDANASSEVLRCEDVPAALGGDEFSPAQVIGSRTPARWVGGRIYRGDPANHVIEATYEASADAAGELAELLTTPSGAYELRAVGPEGQLRASFTELGPCPRAALVGDRTVWSRRDLDRSELHAVRVRRTDSPVSPVEELGVVPVWSEIERCQSASGMVAWLHDPVERAGENATRFEAATATSVVFSSEGPTKVVQTTLDHDPDDVGCDDVGSFATSIRADRRRPGARRHEIRSVECTPGGCSTRTIGLAGIEAWWPAVARSRTHVLLAWWDDRGAVVRFAPINRIASAEDHVLLPGKPRDDEAVRAWAFVRPGSAVALFERGGALWAARILPNGGVRWPRVLPVVDPLDQARSLVGVVEGAPLPAILSFPQRHGIGGPIRGR